MPEYRLKFRIDLGKGLPTLGKMLEEVSKFLPTGEGSLSLVSEVSPYIVKANRELTVEEQEKLGKAVETELNKSLPMYDFKLLSCERVEDSEKS